MVVYGRWSLIRGGRLQEVVAYGRWSFTGGGRLREVVTYGRWLLTKDGRQPEARPQEVYISGNMHMLTRPFLHNDITVSLKSLQRYKLR